MLRDIEMAIDILELTHDGYDLYQSAANVERHGRNGDGWQLALLQAAANHWLTPDGMTVLAALHQQVSNGDYKYPLAEFLRRFCPELSKPSPAKETPCVTFEK
jgi:hypothetical protein